MAVQLLSIFLAVQAVNPIGPVDAVSRYRACVVSMAAARAGTDALDAEGLESATACEGLRPAAVDQVIQAASGSPEEAKNRIGALLEQSARREAVAISGLIERYYQEQKR